MKNEHKVEQFWQAYLDSLPVEAQKPSSYEAWHFCDNEKDADECGALVVAGIKTATCSLLWEYAAEDEELPRLGDHSIVTNWNGDPLCIIETVEVEAKQYNQVDEKFAYDEGEGDRSLEYWRRVHWDAFSRWCAIIKREPAVTMPLVCQRLRVVFSGGGQ